MDLGTDRQLADGVKVYSIAIRNELPEGTDRAALLCPMRAKRHITLMSAQFRALRGRTCRTLPSAISEGARYPVTDVLSALDHAWPTDLTRT
jgi:hypothetical protein